MIDAHCPLFVKLTLFLIIAVILLLVLIVDKTVITRYKVTLLPCLDQTRFFEIVTTRILLTWVLFLVDFLQDCLKEIVHLFFQSLLLLHLLTFIHSILYRLL